MSTQRVDRKEFRRVRGDAAEKPKSQGADNEIRVTAQRGQRNYISYAIAILTGADDKPKSDSIKISGMGAAIFNAVNIAEIVKRRVKGLYQITEISSETVKDSYEGVENKDKKMDIERKVATILITLSTKALDKKALGYQDPLPEDQVTEQEDRDPAERRPRGSGRGGRGGRGSARGGRGGRGGAAKKDVKKDEKKTEKTAERGGRGSGRGGRGGRGGSDKPKTVKPDYQKLGDDFEDKLDRQKGDGHNKSAPSHQGKPKSVRTA